MTNSASVTCSVLVHVDCKAVDWFAVNECALFETLVVAHAFVSGYLLASKLYIRYK